MKGRECGKDIYQRKDGVRYTKPVRAVDDIKFLTVAEQEKFMDAAKRSHSYRQYALLLETGLRTAEWIGLTWDSVDWMKYTLAISKSLEYRHKEGCWRASPKTEKSHRGRNSAGGTSAAGSSIKTATNRYVHVTNESLVNAVAQFGTVCAKAQ